MHVLLYACPVLVRHAPVAGAEGAVVVSRVGERHAAQVRADADDHHELRLEAALLVRLLVAEVLHQHGCLLLEHTHNYCFGLEGVVISERDA